MSRKVLIIAAAVALLVATPAAPAMGSALKAEDVFPAQTKAGPRLSVGPSVWPLPIQTDGGSESGGAGGCPT